MTSKYYDIIIVGAGIAGISAIKKIREYTAEISILLISNEDRLPYKRTKINKHIAKGFTRNQFSLNPSDWFLSQNVELIYDNVLALHVKDKRVQLANNVDVAYNKLLLTTGAHPFIPNIEGVDSNELLTVHYAKSVELLIRELQTVQKILIIGGGVEGIETAYELLKLNKEVHIVDSNKNALARLFPDKISDRIFDNMTKQGLIYYKETRVESVQKKEAKYDVILKGEKLSFDKIIICAGTRPNIDIAKQAGIKTKKGIVVNEFMQTSNLNVFAAGDVAEHAGGIVTGLWHPSEYQGISVGQNILGKKEAYQHAPLRLKTSVFGEFYFSANYFKSKELNTQCKVFSCDEIFGELYLQNNVVVGLTMVNDKENAKKYQQVVAKMYSLINFQQEFPNHKVQ